LTTQLGKDNISEMKKCQTEEILIDLVEDALVKLDRSKDKPVPHLKEAHMGLITARALWDEHRVACPVCNRQWVN
jgi:hypothetical protein